MQLSHHCDRRMFLQCFTIKKVDVVLDSSCCTIMCTSSSPFLIIMRLSVNSTLPSCCRCFRDEFAAYYLLKGLSPALLLAPALHCTVSYGPADAFAYHLDHIMLHMADVIMLLLWLSIWLPQSLVLLICTEPLASLNDMDILAEHTSGRCNARMQTGLYTCLFKHQGTQSRNVPFANQYPMGDILNAAILTSNTLSRAA